MFDTLGRLAVQHPWKICAAWLALAIGLSCLAPNWANQSQDDDIRFLPANTPSVRGYQLLEQAFPQDVFASRALVTIERSHRPLSPTDLMLVDRLVARLEQLRANETELHIGSIVSRRDGLIGSRLTSADGHCTLIQFSLATPYMAVQTRQTVDAVETALRQEFNGVADAPTMYITGPAGVGRDLVAASAASLDHTTLATVVLVIVVLLLVYRSPLLALVPIVTIAISVWVALKLLALVTLIPGVHLVNISQVFAVVILFGAGTDYCLFLISRYREELVRGREGPDALHFSVRAVGGALAASAGTVVCGLGMMGFADFAKVRCAGPVIGLGLSVGLAASLTLTPALLRIFGKAVFWPMKVEPRQRGQKTKPPIWNSIARYVVKKPGLVLGASVAALLPFAILGALIVPSFSPIGDLNPSSGSVRGLNVIQQRFTAGETGPLTVLLSADRDWDSPAGKQLIDRLSRGFAQLENVAEVRSLTQPLGKPTELTSAVDGLGKLANLLGSKVSILDRAKEMVHSRYLSRLPETETESARSVTRLDVVLKTDPFSPASIESLKLVELWLKDLLPKKAKNFGPVQAETYGVTVHTRDLGIVIERDRLRVNALVLAGVFLILLFLVRKFWLAAYLLVTVLLSYFATIGMTALFTAVWADRPIGAIEWRVPFFLFTILVAVGEDYNILMVTRALQERRKHGTKKGIRRGLARTGGTITACGVIMAGTFATLMIAGLGTLVQIGFALAVGVMLDTFLVRPLLVPAFMVLVMKDTPRKRAIKPVTLELRKAG